MNEIKVEPYIPDEDYDNPAMVVDFYEFTMANCLFLHGFPATHAVDHFFIDRQHVGLFADFRQLFHRDPLYRSVFVRLDPQRFFLVGNDAVGDVIVLMCRNGNALFLM